MTWVNHQARPFDVSNIDSNLPIDYHPLPMSEKPTKIRPARPGDEKEILALIRELAVYEKLGDQVVATEAQIAETLFESKQAECLLAEVDNRVAGFAIFFHNYSTFLAQAGIYLEDLFVRPEFRGYGVGKLLLKSLANLATQRKCGRLDWSVLTWNEPAIKFYDAIGARRLSDWVGYRLDGEALTKFAH